MLKIIRALLRFLPTAIAANLTIFFAMFPRKFPLNDRGREALAQASIINFNRKGRRVAYSWGDGPLVILVHGWEGCAAQMAPIAMRLADRGYQAVALDVRGHGESEGKRTNFWDFQEDIAGLTQHMDRPVHAYVCHSAGGLLMMAARYRKLIKANYYVALASPRGPYPPLDIIKKMLKVTQPVIDRCQVYVAKQFDCPWPELLAGEMFQYQDQGKCLLIYDENDKLVDHTDADKILKYWPEARLIKTNNYNHSSLLWSPEVLDEVPNFLSGA